MRRALGAGITAFLTCADLAVKEKIEEEWKTGETRECAGGRIIFRKVHNYGMCLNLLEKHPEIVRYTSLAVCGIVTVFHACSLRQKGKWLRKAGLSLVTAGAWSNTIDRCARGYVVDYVGVQTPSKRISRITYNLGDFFIGAGSILLLLTEVCRGEASTGCRKDKRNKKTGKKQ